MYQTMCEVIKRRGLDLKFEHEDKVWSLPPDEQHCDHLIGQRVLKNYDGGLLLRNYTPCDHVGKVCDRDEYICIGARINGSKIECIETEVNRKQAVKLKKIFNFVTYLKCLTTLH